MASSLNQFKTTTYVFTLSNTTIYTAPAGKTSILLNAQATNVTGTDASVTFLHERSGTETELVDELVIPAHDTAGLTTGKVVLEAGDTVKGFASAGATIKLSLSYLETIDA
jgi:hypothetical protein